MSRHPRKCQIKSPLLRGGLPTALTALILLWLTPLVAFGDEVILTTGGRLEGTIEVESPERIVIVTRGNNRMTIPRSQVAEIHRADSDENALLRARLSIQEGDLVEMMDVLEEALEGGIAPQRVAAELLRTPTALATLIENAPPREGEQIRNFVLQVLSQIDPSNEVYHLAGRICQVTGADSRADDAYRQIAPAWWLEHPDCCGDVSLFYLAQARRAMEERNFQGALDALTKMTVVDPQAASELQPIFLIQMAHVEADNGNWREAVRIIKEEVAPRVPEIARLNLESLFLEMVNRPQTGPELREAAAVFNEYAPELFPEDATERMIKLNLRLGEMLLGEGDFAGARAAFNRYYDLADPDVFLRKRVLAATILEEISQLPPDDWDNRIRLTTELLDSELWEEAVDQCRALSNAPDERIRNFAIQNRHAIQTRLGREKFDRAMELYDEGDFAGALDLIVEDAEIFYDARLIDEVNSLRGLCQQRLSEIPNQRALQAWNLYQQAERHFVIGQLDEAVAILEPMLRQYPNTSAAEQGQIMVQTANRFRRARQPDRSDIRAGTPAPVSPEATLEDETLRELEEMFNALEEIHPDS